MKYISAAFIAAIVIGLSACGGGTTTVVKQAAPPPAATTTTQATQEEQDAKVIVTTYAQTHPKMCDVFNTGLSYQAELRAFTTGYLKTNPSNYPNAKLMYDTTLAYCQGPTA